LTALESKGDPLIWDPRPRQNRPGGLSEASDKFLTAKTRKGTRCAAYCHALWRAHTAAISPPCLASHGSGPDRPLLGLFKSRSGTHGIWDGQHEARATCADRGQLFRCCSNGSAGCLVPPAGPLDPMGPMLAPVLSPGRAKSGRENGLPVYAALVMPLGGTVRGRRRHSYLEASSGLVGTMNWYRRIL
jgi:hypothetical protein